MSEEKFLSPQECEFPDDVPKIGQVVQSLYNLEERLQILQGFFFFCQKQPRKNLKNKLN